jgi:hypothetical protein
VTDTLELSAKRIAERGRDELLSKLRPAFAEAASAHADVLKLEPDQLEQMVQRAADRADGLQWRRALASVATEELGIGLGEALGHPAVQRAQAMIGAPSYEESLAALRTPPQNGNGAAAQAPPELPKPEPEAHPKRPEPTVVRPAPQAPQAAPAPQAPQDAPAPQAPQAAPAPRAPQAAPAPRAQQAAPAPQAPPAPAPKPAPRPAPAAPRKAAEQPAIRVTAIHLGGVSGLRPGETEIELRLSDDGLDIARQPGELFGRLTWTEMHGLEVPPVRGRLLRRREPRAHLVVRAEHGDASFEIPAVAPEELREHLEPLLVRHGLPPAG